MRNLTLALWVLVGCGQVDESRHLGKTDGGSCDQASCAAGDGCCPAACNANNDSDCTPKCGNNVVEMGETCDGNCTACAAESLTCFTQTGNPSTCDLQCHVPQQTCSAGDMCCPFVMGSNGSSCSNASDTDCAGTSWRFTEVNWSNTGYPFSWAAGGSITTRIYGINPGDSILLTTCTPDGSANTSDTLIVQVTDNGVTPLFSAQDDTTDPGALPRLAGWNCMSTSGTGFPMSTAPQNPGGFKAGPNTYRIDVTLGGHAGAAGSSKLYIWWNGTSGPNSG